MKVALTSIPDVLSVEPRVFGDACGFFYESFNQKAFDQATGPSLNIVQDNHRQLWVPPGFAHGFVGTSESADFRHKTTDHYAPEHERCIAWNDLAIGIEWPLARHGIGAPLLSAKDLQGARLSDAVAALS